jgi:hypothetical protein
MLLVQDSDTGLEVAYPQGMEAGGDGPRAPQDAGPPTEARFIDSILIYVYSDILQDAYRRKMSEKTSFKILSLIARKGLPP